MTAIIELINKILDFIKSFTGKKTKARKPLKVIRLRDYFDSKDRKNLADVAKNKGLLLMKDTNGELVITKTQASILWKYVEKGAIQGAKRVAIITKLAKEVF